MAHAYRALAEQGRKSRNPAALRRWLTAYAAASSTSAARGHPPARLSGSRQRRGPAPAPSASDAYATFAEKAAVLLHSLARNHPLADGNTRLAWAATRSFCLLNGRDLAFAVDEAEALVVGAATGELDVHRLAGAIDEHLQPRA